MIWQVFLSLSLLKDLKGSSDYLFILILLFQMDFKVLFLNYWHACLSFKWSNQAHYSVIMPSTSWFLDPRLKCYQGSVYSHATRKKSVEGDVLFHVPTSCSETIDPFSVKVISCWRNVPTVCFYLNRWTASYEPFTR